MFQPLEACGSVVMDSDDIYSSPCHSNSSRRMGAPSGPVATSSSTVVLDVTPKQEVQFSYPYDNYSGRQQVLHDTSMSYEQSSIGSTAYHHEHLRYEHAKHHYEPVLPPLPTLPRPSSSKDTYWHASSYLPPDQIGQQSGLDSRGKRKPPMRASSGPPGQYESTQMYNYTPSPDVLVDSRLDILQQTPQFMECPPSPPFWSQPSHQSNSPYSDRPTSSEGSSYNVAEERPSRRRRSRLSATSSVASVSSEAESTGSSPQPQNQSCGNSRGQARGPSSSKGGRLRKTRAKRTQAPPEAQSSFSTFMVKPSPATYEPVGATYMSTVNLQSDLEIDTFDHGPTELPPRSYMGGPDAVSPWKPRKNLGTIPGSAMDYLPVVEGRMARLEDALGAYVEHRGQQALRNAQLPSMDN